LRTRFGPEEGSVGKVKSRKATRTDELCAEGAPVKAAGDHQVQNKPEIVLQTNANTLAHSPEAEHLLAFCLLDGRNRGPNQRRRHDADLFQLSSADARLQRIEINHDVREFRHEIQLMSGDKNEQRRACHNANTSTGEAGKISTPRTGSSPQLLRFLTHIK